MVYYQRADGETPAEEFIEGMDGSGRYDMYQVIMRVGRLGLAYDNPKKFKKFQGHGNLYELISHQDRVFGFMGMEGDTGKRQLVLTNGFTKKTKKTPPDQIERACRLREEYSYRRSQP